MRNKEKDAIEMAIRREKLLDAGFRIFSEQTIEAVSLQQVTDAAGVGAVTVYRYFGNKGNLVVEILAKQWTAFLKERYRCYEQQGMRERSAAEQYGFFLDSFELLYRAYKPLLRLNVNFTTFSKHENMTAEEIKPLMDVVQGMIQRAHNVFLKGREDGTLRTELGETQIVTATLHTMLAVAGKYAGGLLYAGEDEEQKIREIRFLIEMFRRHCTREPGTQTE